MDCRRINSGSMDYTPTAPFCGPLSSDRRRPELHQRKIHFAAADRIHSSNWFGNCSIAGRTVATNLVDSMGSTRVLTIGFVVVAMVVVVVAVLSATHSFGKCFGLANLMTESRVADDRHLVLRILVAVSRTF